MADLTELPEWVWNLLDAVTAYEAEHPLLYRFTGDGKDGYERTECVGSFLSQRLAWPPRELQDAAEFRRHILRECTPAPAGEEADHG